MVILKKIEFGIKKSWNPSIIFYSMQDPLYILRSASFRTHVLRAERAILVTLSELVILREEHASI